MIALKNIKTAKDENASSYRFETGINYLPQQCGDLFNLLTIRDQRLIEGEFFIDDYNVVKPSDFKRTVFVLDVNSSILKLTAVFLISTDDYFGFKKQLKKDLILLKALPLNTNDEKKAKINRMFETLIRYHISYFLIDLNDDINHENGPLILESVEAHKNESIFVFQSPKVKETLAVKEELSLDQPVMPFKNTKQSEYFNKKYDPKKQLDDLIKPTDFDDNAYNKLDNISIGNSVDTEEKAISNEKKKKPEKKAKGEKAGFDFVKTIFKQSAFSITFALIFAFALVFVMEMAISFILKGETTGGAILLVVSIIGTLLDIYLIACSYQDGKRIITNKSQHWTFVSMFSLMNLVGILLGLGLYLVLASQNIELFSGGIRYQEIVGAISVAVVLIVSNLIANYLEILLAKVQHLLKKKK